MCIKLGVKILLSRLVHGYFKVVSSAWKNKKMFISDHSVIGGLTFLWKVSFLGLFLLLGFLSQ